MEGVHNSASMSTTQDNLSTTSPLKINTLHRYSGAMIHNQENPELRLEDTKSVRGMSGEVSGVSRGKTHLDYWFKKVFRQSFSTGDGRRESGAYSVKIQFSGRRESFPLNTANRPEAAKKAKMIWVSLVANGWDKTLATYKPQAVFVPPTFTTVGSYLDFLEEHKFYTPQALYRNQTKFFTALSSIVEDIGENSRFRLRGKRLEAENARLRAVRLSDLSPLRIESWKGRYLEARSATPVQALRAKHTLDSYIRAAKAMFGPKIRKRLASVGITIPEPIPFATTEFVSRGRSAFRYRSKIDPFALTKLAVETFQEPEPELLKVFLLALHLGLRRNEIDKLLWSQFDFDQNKLHIEATEYAALKTEGSEDEIILEPELAEYFGREFERASSIFVISSENKPRATSGWDHYRAHSVFTRLCGWLRENGVNTQKPIHTLRKEFGKIITEKLGLYAASLGLRHSTPTVTATYYADDTRPKHTGLGKLIRIGNSSAT